MHTTVLQKEHQQARQNCGIYQLEGWVIVEGKGKDLFSFLQTQTTNDVNQLEAGQGQNSAIVDRKGKLVATFSIHKTGPSSALFVIESGQDKHFINHLESYIFREDIQLQTIPKKLLAIQGPRSSLALKSLFGNQALPEKLNETTCLSFENKEVIAINKSLTGDEGCILGLLPPSLDRVIDLLLKVEEGNQPVIISPETWETLRIEAGVPLFGKDMDEKNILPETGLEHSSVSYNKGCYIGQEVIARIKTYGAPNFALMGLIIEGKTLPPKNSELFLGSKKIGSLKSSTYSFSLQKNIALAYIHKDHRSPNISLDITIKSSPYKVETRLLPFYQPSTKREHSKRLLDQALKIYKEKEDLDEPIAILRESIALDPKNAAAYEALGVFLAKQNKLEEAIALMKRLAEIDPEEIMAHTNLSIYYMKQGRIEEAEQEKGEATAIQFEKMVSDNMAKKAKEKKEVGEKQERERKIEMFNKVLEIDPKDTIANFGLGSIHLECGRFEEALGPLQTVIEENKDYSAAYLLLGKTWEKLSQGEEAIEVYRKGIAAASKKGDLMPLKDMQSRLNQMLHSKP